MSVDALDRPFDHKRGENAVTEKIIPTPEELRNMLRYEPETGKLFWKVRPNLPGWWNSRFSGCEALTAKNEKGYLQGHIDGCLYRAHRVIWAIVYGYWPKDEIDHKNTKKSDNRLCNIRLATSSQNQSNKGLQSNNTSGAKGVSYIKETGKWRARIRCHGNLINLGSFSEKDEAVLAYANAAEKLHGKFARSV